MHGTHWKCIGNTETRLKKKKKKKKTQTHTQDSACTLMSTYLYFSNTNLLNHVRNKNKK